MSATESQTVADITQTTVRFLLADSSIYHELLSYLNQVIFSTKSNNISIRTLINILLFWLEDVLNLLENIQRSQFSLLHSLF